MTKRTQNTGQNSTAATPRRRGQKPKSVLASVSGHRSADAPPKQKPGRKPAAAAATPAATATRTRRTSKGRAASVAAPEANSTSKNIPMNANNSTTQERAKANVQGNIRGNRSKDDISNEQAVAPEDITLNLLEGTNKYRDEYSPSRLRTEANGGILDLNPPYQRPGDVWGRKQKQDLMYSLLRGFDIPKIYVREIVRNKRQVRETVDGKQRTTAILQFMNDEFPLNDKITEVSGMRFSELPDGWRQRFVGSKLDVTVFEDYPEELIREMFLLFQHGTKTNSQEERNAGMGRVRDMVAKLTENPIFSQVTFSNKRLGFQQIAAQLMLVTLKGGEPTTVSKSHVDTMYKNSKASDQTVEDAYKAADQILTWLSEGFEQIPTEELKVSNALSKGGLISAYVLAINLAKEYDISEHNVSFAQEYVKFYKEFRADQKIDTDKRKGELVLYSNFSGSGSDSKRSIGGRHEILMKRFKRYVKTLPEYSDEDEDPMNVLTLTDDLQADAEQEGEEVYEGEYVDGDAEGDIEDVDGMSGSLEEGEEEED